MQLTNRKQIAWIFVFALSVMPLKCLASDCVILLHGMARSSHSMHTMENYFKAHHYIVINQRYPSTQKPIQSIADNDIEPMVSACNPDQSRKIHFITHSLGGIVLRQYLANHKLKNLGRIVMLSPPNHGSPLADMLKDDWLYQKITGQAGQALTTSDEGLPNQLPNANKYQIGIIAGNISPTGRLFFHSENDGKVSVESTKIIGMKDFIVLPVSHTFMMRNPIVLKQALSFIQSGRFLRA